MSLLILSFLKEGYSREGGRFLSRKNILKINETDEDCQVQAHRFDEAEEGVTG